MRIASSGFLWFMMSAGMVTYAQPGSVAEGGVQAAPIATQGVQAPATAANAAAPPAPAVTATSLLQPALTQAQATLSTLKIDKWKKGSVRDEAGANVNALLHDLQTNIPPLITAADAEPGALSRAIPLIKHLDAFYDVLLRVEEASRVSAPSDQISALQQTLLDVNKARIAYDDQLQAQAATHEKDIFDLQTELRAQKEEISAQRAKAAAATATPCKPATPTRRKRRTTTGSKPSASTPAPQKPQ
jgi:hypothetical protein